MPLKTSNQILPKDHPLLRRTAEPVPAGETAAAAVRKTLKRMSEVLAPIADGVALAAPQIGIPWRIFIVSGKLFPDSQGRKGKDLVFINPEIVKVSKRKMPVEEGCLSARGCYGLVRRAEKVTVSAFDENGRKFVRHTSGLFSQICQHEVDHLDGVLFLDKAKNVRELKN